MLKTVLILAVISATILGNPVLKPQIIGGTDAKRGDNPHMCSLRSYSHGCGASIISAKWAITAAHCVAGVSPSARTLRCGTLLHASGGKDYAIAEIITHSDYNSGSPLNNDIALLRIEAEFDLGTQDSNIIQLAAQGSDVAAGTVVTITGWGRLQNGVNIFPDTLQTVDIPVVERNDCKEKNRDILPVTDAMFCAGLPDGGVDACQADSGGPVKYNGQLVGLVSWGNECALPNFPGVYTRVGQFRDWIKQNSGV